MADTLQTPSHHSPQQTATPPLATVKHQKSGLLQHAGHSRAGSEPVDPNALTKALRRVDETSRSRERTPVASPSRKRQRVYGDR